MSAHTKSMTRKTVGPKLCWALTISMLVWLGGRHGVEAGVDAWTTNGPYGGPVSALVIDPRTPSTLYAATGGGVFKSSDSGASWGRVGGPSAYTLAIDPQTPTTLYAGAYRGVFKSTDGGASWRSSGLSNGGVRFLVVDPVTPTTIYAGTFGFNASEAP